jgi:hypothetical protein
MGDVSAMSAGPVLLHLARESDSARSYASRHTENAS